MRYLMILMVLLLMGGCIEIDGESQLDPNFIANVDKGVGVGEVVGGVVVSILPRPWSAIGALVLGGLTTGWAAYKNAKTKRRLEYVELGARITADSVNKIITPSLDVWDNFKAAQKSGSANTLAIMPDKV